MIPAPPTLDRLTREIFHYEDQAVKHAANAVQFKAEIGQRLIEAKKLLPHGQFLTWAESTFRWNRRHIARHMLLAKHATRVSHLPADASLRMALAAIAGGGKSASGGSARPEHVRFTLAIGGEELLIEVKRGNPELLGHIGATYGLDFKRIEK